MASLFTDLYNSIFNSPAKSLRRQANIIAEADRNRRWPAELAMAEKEIKAAVAEGETRIIIHVNRDLYYDGAPGYKWARKQGFEVLHYNTLFGHAVVLKW